LRIDRPTRPRRGIKLGLSSREVIGPSLYRPEGYRIDIMCFLDLRKDFFIVDSSEPEEMSDGRQFEIRETLLS